MRTIIVSGRGAVEVNWSWLPTWIGMNSSLIKEIEVALSPTLLGQSLNTEVLDKANTLLIDFLVKKFKVPGLFDYLDGLKYISEGIPDENWKTKSEDR